MSGNWSSGMGQVSDSRLLGTLILVWSSFEGVATMIKYPIIESWASEVNGSVRYEYKDDIILQCTQYTIPLQIYTTLEIYPANTSPTQSICTALTPLA